MDKSNMVLKNLNNPHELERLYRKDPEAFKQEFLSAWEQNSDSQVLAVWYERLYFKEKTKNEKAPLLRKETLFMGFFAILSGVFTRIIYYLVERETISFFNFLFGVLPFITAYLVYKTSPNRKVVFSLVFLFLVSAVYINFLPVRPNDSQFLAYLHLPIFLWILVGVAFTGDQYRSSNQRLAYLKFNGEVLIIYVCMAISGGMLTVLTIQLFHFLNINISEFLFKNVILFCAASLAIVASYLGTKNLKLAKNIAPYLSKIFSPLVLATLLVYLISIIWVEKNPFLDRDFLLFFNGILLVVMSVTIFSITERGTDPKKNIWDFINVALIGLALIINSVALSAIIFRLSSYGISPNRVAVLGLNILMWANFIWIIISYTRFLQKKAGLLSIQDSITNYLPIYGLWAAFVTFAFPLIF